jgi:phospholipid/cholesterol/gamma-HCH transport system substrate-binding protein
VANLDQAAAGLPHSAGNVDGLVDELRATVNDAHQVINDIHAATQTASVDFVAAVQKLRATSDNLERASGNSMPSSRESRSAQRLRARRPAADRATAARQPRRGPGIRDLSRSLRDNPSQLIYQPAANGVVIPP